MHILYLLYFPFNYPFILLLVFISNLFTNWASKGSLDVLVTLSLSNIEAQRAERSIWGGKVSYAEPLVG